MRLNILLILTICCFSTYSQTKLQINKDTGVVSVSSDEILTCQGDPFVTLEFGSSRTEIDAGESIILNWEVENATQCTASGAWNGTVPSSDGPHSQLIGNILESSIYQLSCTNGNNTAFEEVAVSVDGAPTCENTPPIPISRDFVVDEFTDTSGLPWGDATGASNIFALTRNMYSAQRFKSPLGDLSKRVVFENGRPSEGGIANYTVSISTCPGDFNVHLNQDKCKASGQTPNISWTTDQADPQLSNKCVLDKNTTYYLNIVHSLNEASNYTISACGAQFSTCGVLFAEIF